MFTGIIEELATIEEIISKGSTLTLKLSSPLGSTFKVDQSVAHQGICLTVTQVNGNVYTVDAIDETISKTNLSKWKVGDRVNLERSMMYQGRLDGHIVQGHVDEVVPCVNVVDKNGSWDFFFEIPASAQSLVIPRGSITLNGVSLTIAELQDTQVKVSIIPYTFEHTTFQDLQIGDLVNVEYDVLGKYVQQYMSIIQP